MVTIGDVLQNRYQVVQRLGAGGMATVYEVLDQRLHTRCALKEAIIQSQHERVQFEFEAQMLASLSHPNLPRVSDHFSEGGGQFLVMELIPGSDLESMLTQQGHPFDVGVVLRWADQLLDALEYLHAQTPPIIHRDIKPTNLKIDGTGRAKLLDFGIAKQQLAGGQTVTAAKAYSLEYSPIEQFSAQSHTDVRSDIYALGATLYHLLTGRPPTSAPERFAGKPLASPATINPQCSAQLGQAILQAMALKPEHRFQSAREFRLALQQQQLLPVVATVAVPPPPVRPPARRSGPRLLLGLAATTIVALLGYIIGTLVLGGEASGSVPSPSPVPDEPVAQATLVLTSPAPPEQPTADAPLPMVQVVTATPLPATAIPPTDLPPTALPPTALPPTALPAPVSVAPPPIVSRSAWGASDALGNNGTQQPRMITLHHDAQQIASDIDAAEMIRRIQRIHQRDRGWVDIAWHYIIAPDGTIYEGHAPTDRADTGYHYDTDGIVAIGVLGNYDVQTPSQAQIDAIVTLMAWLCQTYGIPPDQIYPHRDFANLSSLTDPKISSPGRNFDLAAIRQQVADRLAGH